ncbi:hypothetical protein KKF84_01515, partial [Myxococcota bacterium]|nr:hypothetical protein [Myxococcota bacterium]
MQIIQCTAKLRKEMGVVDSALYEGNVNEGVLGPWHANLISIDRRKCVLFANDKTLFNFLVPDVRRPQIRDLGQLFLQFLFPVLSQEGFTETECEKIASEYNEVQFAKSSSRAVLGSMNELA